MNSKHRSSPYTCHCRSKKFRQISKFTPTLRYHFQCSVRVNFERSNFLDDYTTGSLVIVLFGGWRCETARFPVAQRFGSDFTPSCFHWKTVEVIIMGRKAKGVMFEAFCRQLRRASQTTVAPISNIVSWPIPTGRRFRQLSAFC